MFAFILILVPRSAAYFENSTKVLLLDQTLYQSHQVGTAPRSWFILFFKPTCPHCQRFIPTWDQLAEQNLSYTSIAAVDVNQQRELSSKFHISGVPTMILISCNGNLHRYQGNRSLDSLLQFAQSMWNSTEPSSNDESLLSDISPSILWVFAILIAIISTLIFMTSKPDKLYEALPVDGAHTKDIEMRGQNPPSSDFE